MKNDEANISESLGRFRKAFNLTQAQIADKLGILQQTYYKYESGRNMPPASIIVRLANAYDVSTDYLLGRSDEPCPKRYDEEKIKEAFAFRDMWQGVIDKAVRSAIPAAGQVAPQ